MLNVGANWIINQNRRTETSCSLKDVNLSGQSNPFFSLHKIHT